MRKGLGILLGLLLMTVFFAGLVMVIRFRQPLQMIGGVLLMILTPPIHHWLYPAVVRGTPLKMPGLVAQAKDLLPLIVPMVLLFVILSLVAALSVQFGYWGVITFLIFMIPAFSVFIDALQGSRNWDLVELSSAWADLTLTMAVKLMVVGSGLCMILIAMSGAITLIFGVGELGLNLFHGQYPYQPALCDQFGLIGKHCLVSLAAWYLGSMLVIVLLLRRADWMLEQVASLLRRLQS